MTEPDLLIEAGFSDARLAAEVKKLTDKYRQAGQAAEKAFQDAQGSVSDNQKLRAHMRELDRLQRAYDPVYTATQKYEAALKRLDRALELGAVDQAKYTAEVKRAQVELSRAAGMVGEEVPRGFRLARHEVQGLGYQVQDFAVQVAGGTDASRAFAQQFPQAASMFGPWGAALGTAAAVIVPLAGYLMATAGAGESLDDSLGELTKSTDAMASSAQAAARPLAELRTVYGDLADEVARANAATAGFASEVARRNIAAAAGIASRQLFGGAFSSDRAVELQGQSAVEQRGLRIQKLAAMLKTSADEARRFDDALAELGRADGPGQVLAITEQLLTTLSASPGAAATFGSEIETLGSINREAARQVEAMRSGVERLLTTYDSTTRELIQLTDDRAKAQEELDKAVTEGNAEQVSAMQRVVNQIDLMIEKTRDLARISDEQFELMASSFERHVGGAMATGMNRIWQQVPDELAAAGERYASDMEAASKGLLELVKRVESGGDYNATLDNGAYTGGARDLVNMTINEVLEMQRQMLAHPSNRKNSSAAGAYQIVRKTLLSLVDELGLTGSELYDPAMQDRLAQELVRRRRGQGHAGLRNEWEGLRGVNDDVIQAALGARSIPREDPQVAAERQRQLEKENRERERKAELVRQYGEQLSRNLLTEQQTAELEAQRARQTADIMSSDMSEADKAAAIAELNAEMQRQITVMALLEEAKRRGVDLDAQMVNSTLTYREAIAALGDAQKERALAEQQAAASTQQLQQAQEFAAQQTQALKDGLVDAIVEGENFADVLQGVAKALAKAALQAALFGDGPMGGGGGGLLGGLFGGMFGGLLGGGGNISAWTPRAAGGPVTAGHPYIVGERGPEPFVPAVNGRILSVSQAQAAVRGGQGGGTVNLTIDVRGATGNSEVRQMVAQGVAQGMSQVRREVPGIMSEYNKRAG